MSNHKITINSLRLIGVANALRSLQYARLRDRLNKDYLTPVHRVPQFMGRLVSAEAVPSGATFRFENGELALRFLTAQMVFWAWDGAGMQPSYAVVKNDWQPVETSLTQAGKVWRFKSGALEVHVGMDATLRYLNPSGKLFRQEEPLQRFECGWLQQTQLSSLACIYGLGERAGRLNLRPGSYRLWNKDAGGAYSPGADPLYINMPVYMSLDDISAHLVFYDTSFDARIHFEERLEFSVEGGAARGYLILGSPQTLLEHFSELTGRPPLPPRWALGYQQSQWGYQTEAEMRRVWQGFRQNDLPLSVFYLDIDHLRGFRTLTPDEKRYPTLKNFASELAEQDVHLVVITNPGIKIDEGFDLYEAGDKEDVYCKLPDGKLLRGVVWAGWTAYPDFTNPRVRAWWGEQYARQLKFGISGFWHDMNEPVSFASSGELTLPLSTQHDLDGRGGDHREAHNVYGLLMNRAAFEGLRKLRPETRPFILSRSGWVGMQRYSWSWSGDVETSWGILRQTVALVLGLGLSGMPYCGPDTGGFTASPSPELYLRWFQLSSFLPFFRTHCALFLPRREPWEFGEEVMGLVRKQLILRYRLLPYWYTLAWQANQSGCPLVRPLFWADMHNPALWEVDDTFLVGDDLLVAPVVEEGARQRPIYLPQGGWYELDSDKLHSQSGVMQLDAPLTMIPVLVRAGSVLPCIENGALVLHAYKPLPGGSGSGTLYSDAGDGYGASRIDRFSLTPSGKGYVFQWKSEGEYPLPDLPVRLHLHGFDVQRVTINKKIVTLKNNQVVIKPCRIVKIG
jgi:alpha-glucosidase